MLIITNSFQEYNQHLLKLERHLKIILILQEENEITEHYREIFDSLHVKLRKFIVFIIYCGDEIIYNDFDNEISLSLYFDSQKINLYNFLKFFYKNEYIFVKLHESLLNSGSFIEMTKTIYRLAVKGKRNIFF